MTTAVGTPRIGGTLTILLAVVAVLVLASVIALFSMQGGSAAPPAPTVPVDTLYGLAIDADSVVGGERAAVDAFSNQLRQLKEDAARDAGAPYTQAPRFSRLLPNAGAVLTAQSSLADASSAARDTRALVPKLLAEVSSVASGLSGPNLASATAALDKIEVRAQRLQLDVAALVAGVGF